MKIWEQLLAEHKNVELDASTKAWVYTKAGFQCYNDLQGLNFSEMQAAIIFADIAEDSVLYEHLSTYSFEKYKLVICKNIERESEFILKTYWPLIADIHLKNDNLPHVLVHMAITLDGKISTECGHSKWIGNNENLIHAHRLRAIVDGILVGANTVKLDKPKLNVRHVKGDNPIRLILSNKTKSFSYNCN